MEEQHSQSLSPQTAKGNQTLLPIAIIIASVVVAGAIVYTNNSKQNAIQIGGGPEVEQQTGEMDVEPVSSSDHIFGNPNAPIVIVEYSDFDCPFCKNFYETMQKIMETYGKDGTVAWVYRQFPIKQLHPNAPKVAEASECVASIGGNDAFWKFADQVSSDRGTNEPTKINKLGEYAENAGVDKAKFTACLDGGTFKSKVEEAVVAATKAGAKGTPYSVMIVGDQQGVIDGAQPYEIVKGMIDTMVAQLRGGTVKQEEE